MYTSSGRYTGAKVSRMYSKYVGFALGPPEPSLIRRPLARKLRNAVSNWWWCVSTKPGMTILPRASTSSAPPACRFVMPGFVDTHHHQFETALRSFLANGLLINDRSEE